MDATVPDEGVAVAVLPSAESAESAESSDEGTGEPECGPEGQPAGQPAGGLVEFVSNRISEMQQVSPDILRATSAGRALRFLARALSQPKGRHHLSFQTQHISCFWSHSWHGSAWKKRLTLLHIYLAPMAAVGSICAAALTTLLFSFKVLLPGFRREEAFRWPKSFWGSAAGAVTYLLVLLIAQPQTSVFLDAISIDQDNPERKVKGLFSMGAFLRHSESILVLWDPSWSHRLWCVFELAAYLRSCEELGKKPKIVIRPTGLGPCAFLQTLALVVVFLALGLVPDRVRIFLWTMQASLCFVGFYVTSATYRHTFRSLEEVRQELQGFRLQDSRCHCCTKGHSSPDEMCDRKILERCVSIWFGSVEAFEEKVRSDVLPCVSSQLDTQLFTYRNCVQTVVPVIWSYMDTASAEMHFNDTWQNLVSELVRGLAWWLGVVPSAYLIGLRCAYCLRKKRSWLCEEAMNSAVVLSIVATVVCAVQLESFCLGQPFSLNDGMIAELSLFCSLVVPAALLLFGCVGTHPHYSMLKE